MGASKARRRTEKWTRKNIVIDQRKLNRAKSILKVSTETDAVDAALDLVVFEGEVLGGIDRLVRAGGLTDPFDER
ncbi:MAG TPA: hypothetical protein VFR18_09990 [Terriglobia bacterium]|nr:hypothetical protein [Terriglobia bacterium]